jgi:hypothetical protein
MTKNPAADAKAAVKKPVAAEVRKAKAAAARVVAIAKVRMNEGELGIADFELRILVAVFAQQGHHTSLHEIRNSKSAIRNS